MLRKEEAGNTPGKKEVHTYYTREAHDGDEECEVIRIGAKYAGMYCGMKGFENKGVIDSGCPRNVMGKQWCIKYLNGLQESVEDFREPSFR